MSAGTVQEFPQQQATDQDAEPAADIDDTGHQPQPHGVVTAPLGCRPRDLDGIAEVLDTLATRVAQSPAMNGTRTATGALWLVPDRAHQWQRPLTSSLLTTLNRRPPAPRPARGVDPAVVTELVKAAAPLAPALLPAAGRLLGGRRLGRRGRRHGRGARVPLVTESELGSMWLAALLGALCGHGLAGRVRLADLATLRRDARPGDHVLFSDVTATAVLWRPRRSGLVRRRGSALAHWTLVSADGNALGAGVVSDR